MILHASCFIKGLTWEIDWDIAQTLPYHVPENCPPDRIYVPPCIKGRLITWAQASLAKVCILMDINGYVSSCLVCAQSKASCSAYWKAHALTMPQQPWSHLAIDFITDPLCSQGNTVIMVVINHFSKPL